MRMHALDLRGIRLKKKATLASFAAALGLSEGHLSRIERGLVDSMDVRLALAIEKLYGVSARRVAEALDPEPASRAAGGSSR